MKRIFIWIGIIILLILIIGIWVFYWQNLRGIAPAVKESSQNITELIPAANNEEAPLQEAENKTGFPLNLPDGFSIAVLAKDLPGARVMAFDNLGNLWISQTSRGIISKMNIENGIIKNTEIIFRNLNNPHGLAFDPADSAWLYVAEENKISKVNINSPEALQKIVDLPGGGGHFTRTLKFGSDGKLYVSIGSSCNVCVENDSRRAKIFSLNKDGSDFKEFATGLRNTVFFTPSPFDGKLWGTDMGRDLLGDNIPPDEINILEEGQNYGWPYCYGKNIHDNNFDAQNAVACGDKTASHIDIQAHSAPLGLAFVSQNSNWPDEYKNNLLVAYHGSWNRSVPTGYKIVRYTFDNQGKPLSTGQDFISGWLSNNDALGRPVDIIFHNEAMYVSDDKAGVIYQITYRQ